MNWLVSDPSYALFLVVDLIAIFTLVAAMRWLSRFLVKPTAQHSEASNIENASAVIALMLALTGVTSGEFSLTLWDEWLLVTTYGLLAIVLLRLGAWTQDKVVLPTLDLSVATQHGNIAAAYITGAHLIGTAIVIRASMEWSSQDANLGIYALLLGFVLSQCLLALETRLRLIWTSGGLLKSIRESNKASIIKAALQHIGAAMAISGSAHFASDLDTQWQLAVVAWLVSSVVFLLAYLALAELCLRIILPKDEAYEGGRAALEGAIYLGWGFLLPALAS
ncbi:MAG: DUF350 domain-containing protein [Gammaproteobacteria bacterium]|nr:DUF350 domain-containing protein [Gammaproteobacteria bacterium]